MSSSYHPQTDGQSEKLNQCLETYLRCKTHACPAKWANWLSLAEFWYNTNYNFSHGKTPFEVLYGYPPRHFGISHETACNIPDLNLWLQDRADMTNLIHQNLLRAQARMKFQADKHRQERSFAVGDWVYLKLQPYVQTSVARRSNQKLSYKFFGPYLILQKIGEVAYKLQLPPSSSVHPVVHVSQLKKAPPPSGEVSTNEELNCLSTDAYIVPDTAVLKCMHKVGNSSVPFAQIAWKTLPSSWVTWENLNAMKIRYTDFAG
jgi:hypothetical protein